MPRAYHVYILANSGKTLYVGITSNLARRLAQHAEGIGSRLVTEHRLNKLVHVETFARPREAIAREKQLKGWVRRRKVALIEQNNPAWRDLRVEWGWKEPLDSEGKRRALSRANGSVCLVSP